MQKIDAEKLIGEVEKRPALWDMKTAEYSDRAMRKQCWEEISDAFAKDMPGIDKSDLGGLLQKKWKNIRDNYSRDILARKRKFGSEGGSVKSPYMYSQQLRFLRDTIEPKETSGGSMQESLEQQPPPGSIEDAAVSPASPTQHSQTTPLTGRTDRKKLNPVEERIILSLERLDRKQSQPAEDDDNRHFLLSLLQNLSSLPKRLNSKCRLELMQVVDKYEELAFMKTNRESQTCSTQGHRNPDRGEQIMELLRLQTQAFEQFNNSNQPELTSPPASPAPSLNFSSCSDTTSEGI